MINLGKHRKNKAREERSRQAERNRQTHGRDKAEKRAAREARARLEQLVDGHRLDNDAPATPDLDLPDARAPEDAPEVAPEAEPADQ